MGSIYERGYNQRLYHNRAADSTAMGAKEVQTRVSPASRHSGALDMHLKVRTLLGDCCLEMEYM